MLARLVVGVISLDELAISLYPRELFRRDKAVVNPRDFTGSWLPHRHY